MSIEKFVACRRKFLGAGVGMGALALSAVGSRAVAANAPQTRQVTSRNPVLGAVGGLHHAAIPARDFDATLKFYQEALGFTVKMIWANRVAAYIDSGNGTCLEIFSRPKFVPHSRASEKEGDRGGDSIVHVCLSTDRLDAAYEHARSHGAKVLQEPVSFDLDTSTGQGNVPIRLCFLAGPSEEVIELLQNAPY